MGTELAVTPWHEVMVDRTVAVGIVTVGAGVLACMIRLFRGPHLVDRAIALDTLAVHVVAFVILMTVRLDSLVLFDGAMVPSPSWPWSLAPQAQRVPSAAQASEKFGPAEIRTAPESTDTGTERS